MARTVADELDDGFASEVMGREKRSHRNRLVDARKAESGEICVNAYRPRPSPLRHKCSPSELRWRPACAGAHRSGSSIVGITSPKQFGLPGALGFQRHSADGASVRQHVGRQRKPLIREAQPSYLGSSTLPQQDRQILRG
jgi:hypothetical protein